MQTILAVDNQVGRSDPLNLGTHGDEQIAQVDNFGLARGIVQNAGALGEAGCHQRIFRGAHRYDREGIGPARYAVGCHGFDITCGQFNFDAKGFERFEMQVNRSVTDGAATRKRHGRFTGAR